MLKLNIKATNLKLEPVIYDYINDKIGGLDKFIENVDHSICQAWVEIGLITRHHQSGNIYRAEAHIRLPARNVRAEAIGQDLFSVIDAVKDELQEELKKYKQKREALYRRGSRLVKRMLKFSNLARLFKRKRALDEGL